MFAGMKKASPIIIMLNTGGLMAMMNGNYLVCKFGDSVFNGGMGKTCAYTGRGNVGKSTLLWRMLLQALYRYVMPIEGGAYLAEDTEVTASVTRQKTLAKAVSVEIDLDVLEEEERFMFSSAAEHTGTEIWELVKDNSCVKNRKGPNMRRLATPFIDKDGNYLTMLAPYLFGLDSLSGFATDGQESKRGKFAAGSKERMDEARASGMGKSQMVAEWPTVTTRNGLWLGCTAHIGDDNRPQENNVPNTKALKGLPHKSKFKGVPENFTLYLYDVWIVKNAKILEEGRYTYYPRAEDQEVFADPDLQLQTLWNARGKSGVTMMDFPVVYSQSEGVLDDVTNFYYCQQFLKDFGITASAGRYKLDLMPDVTVTRKSVRGYCADPEHKRFCRALELTMELGVITHCFGNYDKSLLCTPRELYEGIIAKGYKWEDILDTRGYWTFDHYTNPVRHLSMEDLLKMRLGRYTPYWEQPAWQEEFGKKEKK